MPRKFYKHKLLLDEGFHLRNRLPLTNSRFNIKHVSADYNLSSLPDTAVYELAKQENRLVVTFNIKDFIKLIATEDKAGVIGISTNLSTEQIDKKLNSLLVRSKKESLLGKLSTITGETEI